MTATERRKTVRCHSTKSFNVMYKFGITESNIPWKTIENAAEAERWGLELDWFRSGCRGPAAPPAWPCSSRRRTRSPNVPSCLWSAEHTELRLAAPSELWFKHSFGFLSDPRCLQGGWLTCCRSSTRGCTQVICTFWSTSSMLPLISPTDRAFITSSSTCRTPTGVDKRPPKMPGAHNKLGRANTGLSEWSVDSSKWPH